MSSARSLPILAAVILTVACGDAGKPSMAEALAEADKKEADRKAAEQAKKDAIKVEKKTDALELPWSFDDLKAGLPMGTALEYQLTGTDAKGKPVEDKWTGEVKANNENEVGVISSRDADKAKPQATQVAMIPWSRVSPFFFVEKSEPEVTAREKVSVPAGEFECVVAELKGFFGAHLTVWMIADKPGVYAKVVDHGNINDEADQTELTYELVSLKLGE